MDLSLKRSFPLMPSLYGGGWVFQKAERSGASRDVASFGIGHLIVFARSGILDGPKGPNL